MSAEGAARPGTVYLVGAGPGDPGLITVRARELVASADLILHDRLIPAAVLEGVRPDAELRYVGKRPGEEGGGQGEINRLLVEEARAERSVVRLKGGDPFVFGRGGEEALALREAGIPFEVVPGITAGIAAPAYAGVPVTQRDRASAVAFVTAHEDPAKSEGAIEWELLARFPGTLVLYMGVAKLAQAAERLRAGGRPADQPAVVVERGTTRRQRTASGTLADIAERAEQAGIEAPAITVIGPVAALRERLAWFELAPLAGASVAVTRARSQASALASRLRGLGANVVEVPAIQIEARPDDPEVARAAREIERYRLVCLSSPNGVRLLFCALAAAGRDARALAGATVAAIGPGTARALAEAGISADIVPERSVSEALVEAIDAAELELAGMPVLLARAADARDVLPDALRDRGAEVDVVALYDVRAEQLDSDQLAAAGVADYLTFTSSSTVRFFCDAVGGPERFPPGPRVVSIGPVTSATARELGLEVHVEAERHDIDGLVDALLADAGDGRPGRADDG